jgi:hypothetical protein
MKLIETHCNKETKELHLNILPFGGKTLFTIYISQIDSSLHPKFYFRTILEVNDNSLLWIEFILGKFIFSLNFLHYERWYFNKWKIHDTT